MIPRGIEILVKKASVDADFKRSLLIDRSGAAELIDLELDNAEKAMLDATTDAHLTRIITETKVPRANRTAFLGYSAAVMLAVLGVAVTGCIPAATGSRPDEPEENEDREIEDIVGPSVAEDISYIDETTETDTDTTTDTDADTEPAILDEHKPNVKGGARPDIPNEGE